MFCLAQARSCLVEILALVNEVCAASPTNAIMALMKLLTYSTRMRGNASAATVPTINSNVLGWLLGRKPTEFPDYLQRPDAEQQ
jgi:hypothetical protein